MKFSHSLAARILIVAASLRTSTLQLWVEDSLVYRAVGSGILIDLINYFIIGVSLFALADIIWHDFRGRFIWPSFSLHLRHRVCVFTYSLLAAGFGVRAFLVADGEIDFIFQTVIYYIVFAFGIFAEAGALKEDAKRGERVL